MNLLSKIMPMHAAVAARLEQAGFHNSDPIEGDYAGEQFAPREPQRGSVKPAQGCLPSEVLLTKEGEATLGNVPAHTPNPVGVAPPITADQAGYAIRKLRELYGLDADFNPLPDRPKYSAHSVWLLVSLLSRIDRFQTRAFPGQTLDGKLKHLVKEAGELRDAPCDPNEWADVLLLLLGALPLAGYEFDDLLRFAHDKMTINENRQWHPADADGCFHHVK